MKMMHACGSTSVILDDYLWDDVVGMIFESNFDKEVFQYFCNQSQTYAPWDICAALLGGSSIASVEDAKRYDVFIKQGNTWYAVDKQMQKFLSITP